MGRNGEATWAQIVDLDLTFWAVGRQGGFSSTGMLGLRWPSGTCFLPWHTSTRRLGPGTLSMSNAGGCADPGLRRGLNSRPQHLSLGDGVSAGMGTIGQMPRQVRERSCDGCVSCTFALQQLLLCLEQSLVYHFICLFLYLFWPHPWLVEVPRPGDRTRATAVTWTTAVTSVFNPLCFKGTPNVLFYLINHHFIHFPFQSQYIWSIFLFLCVVSSCFFACLVMFTEFQIIQFLPWYLPWVKTHGNILKITG